jgi:hypothetical protein
MPQTLRGADAWQEYQSNTVGIVRPDGAWAAGPMGGTIKHFRFSAGDRLDPRAHFVKQF